MNPTRLALIAVLVAATPILTAGEAEEPAATGMTPEQEEAFAKLSQPGEHHRHLAKMAGTWEVEATIWMEPGAPPSKAKGVSHNEMILGGRFLQSRYKSEFMGEPFTGIGIDGYDNGTGKHLGVWIDSAGTAVYRFEGSCSEGGKVISTFAEVFDPVRGEMKTSKAVLTIDSEDQYTFEAWDEQPSGSFHRSMVLVYRRLHS